MLPATHTGFSPKPLGSRIPLHKPGQYLDYQQKQLLLHHHHHQQQQHHSQPMHLQQQSQAQMQKQYQIQQQSSQMKSRNKEASPKSGSSNNQANPALGVSFDSATAFGMQSGQAKKKPEGEDKGIVGSLSPAGPRDRGAEDEEDDEDVADDAGVGIVFAVGGHHHTPREWHQFGRVRVLTLIRNSCAEKCGQIRHGDFLCKINGEDVTHMDLDYIRLRCRGAMGTPISFEFERHARQYSVTLVRTSTVDAQSRIIALQDKLMKEKKKRKSADKEVKLLREESVRYQMDNKMLVDKNASLQAENGELRSKLGLSDGSEKKRSDEDQVHAEVLALHTSLARTSQLWKSAQICAVASQDLVEDLVKKVHIKLADSNDLKLENLKLQEQILQLKMQVAELQKILGLTEQILENAEAEQNITFFQQPGKVVRRVDDWDAESRMRATWV